MRKSEEPKKKCTRRPLTAEKVADADEKSRTTRKVSSWARKGFVEPAMGESRLAPEWGRIAVIGTEKVDRLEKGGGGTARHAGHPRGMSKTHNVKKGVLTRGKKNKPPRQGGKRRTRRH